MTREEAKSYVDHWKRVGPLLESIERDELRRLTHADRMRSIQSVLELGAQFARPRVESGFYEQQRLFHSRRP